MNETPTSTQLAHRDIDRFRRYREFLDFYNGQHWEGRATGYAAVEWAAYAINRVNVGGTTTPDDLLTWGQARLKFFRGELRRLGRRNRVRARSLYRPYYPPVSESTDYGP